MSKEVITSHVFVVPPGGDGEGVRENQGGKPVVLAILVDDSEELQLFGVVGALGSGAPHEDAQEERQHNDDDGKP